MTVAVIIVAAGSGIRAGGNLPKQYQTLGDRPMLRRTIECFLHHPMIDIVQTVIGADHDALFYAAADGLDLPAPVTGGATRQTSVRNGLRALALISPCPRTALIHDGARPFVPHDLIDRVLQALDTGPAAIPGLPVVDTLKRAPAGRIEATVPRDDLWAVQTPQGFRYADILDAHERAAAAGLDSLTDDAAVAEWAGLPVAVVPGDPQNRKITASSDLSEAHRKMSADQLQALPDIRTGTGYDVHAFEPGDHVVLCGVPIPHEARLKGHSDADVAMHALTDAILGAICEGDIGKHFPPSDPQWQAADSTIFLQAAAQMVRERGGMIAHGDVTVVCEFPKLAPYIDTMRARLAEILQIPLSRLSVKATTSERLGFTGRREGIAALASATVRLPG